MGRIVVDGPLAPFGDGLRRDLVTKGYALDTIVDHVHLLAGLSGWLSAQARLGRCPARRCGEPDPCPGHRCPGRAPRAGRRWLERRRGACAQARRPGTSEPERGPLRGGVRRCPGNPVGRRQPIRRRTGAPTLPRCRTVTIAGRHRSGDPAVPRHRHRDRTVGRRRVHGLATSGARCPDMSGLRVALSLFTVLPAGQVTVDRSNARRAVLWLPWSG
jgi:hypothetical protein